MAKSYTPNYKLTKDDQNEFYDVTVQSGNMDLIDSEMKALENGQTASEIIAKLKTVDGLGSGLDADLLDGKHIQSNLTDRSDALMRVGAFGWGGSMLPDIATAPENILYTSLFRVTTARALSYGLPTDNGGILFTKAYNSIGNLYAAQEYTVVNLNKTRVFYRNLNLGVWTLWRESSWIEKPTEGVITSGFASDWSGSIKYRKNQEGLVTLWLDLLKSTDISSVEEILYSLPVGLRPTDTVNQLKNLYDISSVGIANSFANINITSGGVIILSPVRGAALTGARCIRRLVTCYYAIV